MGITRESRAKRMLLATMRGDRPGDRKVVIGDVSPRGLGARARGECPTVGSRVAIALSNGMELQGEVRWVRNDRFGIQLDRSIDPADVQGSGGSWDVVNRPFDQDHVYDQFRPVTRPYRPGLKVK